ncbi:MAG: glycoside hydrolase [Prevotella sp.]|uniref:Glycoside hydrolase n=1 Tax=Segatella cerevisiae TaxID=2053716 RepID=A0ABT1BZS0_9BACT|nr:sialidase family protein [Segatella cerevisiae]MCH3994185.1 glycoside hydrolase [Prevotella sp.]MCI1246616.1 glycoside hydrolase [Prevotella sp.]MCO6026195.1 glycoside hydrolase [Segatella cerevisiae]
MLKTELRKMQIRGCLCLLGLLFLVAPSQSVADVPVVPGTVIDHIPKSTGKFIGSPSICILPDGVYIASHDEFGPRSAEWQDAVTDVFRSSDRGKTWEKVSRIEDQFWSNLFYHDGALYIMGTNKHHGNLVIRRSTDEGKSWTVPYDSSHGLLLEGEYHTAPVPMVISKGRIWRALEYATGKSNAWGVRYSAMMVSAPVHADLLKAANWQATNHLPFNKQYLDGHFGGWLEGNAVPDRTGEIVDVLRVHTPQLTDEYCAIVTISSNGKQAEFDPENFYKMPGAATKFTIRYDEQSHKYWAIVNAIPDKIPDHLSTDQVRNTLALVSSTDLKQWTVDRILLHHPDAQKHAFQYADWQFDNKNIIFVSRTSFDDEEGGASSYHDSNFFTFHRITDFRNTSRNSR